MRKQIIPSSAAKLLKDRIRNKKDRKAKLNNLLREKKEFGVKRFTERKSMQISEIQKKKFCSPRRGKDFSSNPNRYSSGKKTNMYVSDNKFFQTCTRSINKFSESFNVKKQKSVNTLIAERKKNIFQEKLKQFNSGGFKTRKPNPIISSKKRLNRQDTLNPQPFRSPQRSVKRRRNIRFLSPRNVRDYKNMLSNSRSIKKIRDRIDHKDQKDDEKLSDLGLRSSLGRRIEKLISFDAKENLNETSKEEDVIGYVDKFGIPNRDEIRKKFQTQFEKKKFTFRNSKYLKKNTGFLSPKKKLKIRLKSSKKEYFLNRTEEKVNCSELHDKPVKVFTLGNNICMKNSIEKRRSLDLETSKATQNRLKKNFSKLIKEKPENISYCGNISILRKKKNIEPKSNEFFVKSVGENISSAGENISSEGEKAQNNLRTTNVSTLYNTTRSNSNVLILKKGQVQRERGSSSCSTVYQDSEEKEKKLISCLPNEIEITPEKEISPKVQEIASTDEDQISGYDKKVENSKNKR